MLRTLLATGVIALAGNLFAAGAAQAAYATTDLNIRTCGSTSCGRIGVIPGGGYVDILGQRGNWLRISHNGLIGWSSASYISDGPVHRRPYYTRQTPYIGFGFTYRNYDFHRPRWRSHHRYHRWGRRHHWGHHNRWRGHRGYRHGLGPWVTWR